MMLRHRQVALFLLLIFFILSASQGKSGEVYKWRDKNGNIFLSDEPPPPGINADKIDVKEEKADEPKTKAPLQKSNKNVQEKRSYRNIQVILYMTSWCPYCVKARNYLRSLDVDLIEYNIERNDDKREEMMRKSGGAKGVPFIDVEGIYIRGYNPGVLKDAVEKRRNI